MATTYVDYTGDGNATKAFSFPSFQESDVKVEVDGVLKTQTTHYNITSYTTTGGGNVVFTSGNIPSSPDAIRIYRDTDVSTNTGEYDPKATYAAGSSVKADDLNKNQKQALYAIWEEKEQTITTNDIKDGAVTGAKIAADAIDGTKLADNAVNSEHYVDGSIDTEHYAANSVGTTALAADAVTGAQLADNSVDSEHYVDGSIDEIHIAAGAVSLNKMANNSVASGNIVNDTIQNTDINTGAGIEFTKLENLDSGKILVGNGSNKATEVAMSGDATIDNAGAVTIATGAVEHAMLANDAVDGDNIADDAIASEHLADGAIQNDHIAAATIQGGKIATGAISATQLGTNSVTIAKIDDAELTTLAGMQSGTASILADSTALTATTAELNLLDGKSIVTTIGASPTDVQIPTAQAVDERITTVVTDVGGFVPIANETSFPATNPDPGDNAGTIVSVKALASNLTSNGSGVATIANGAGSGNTVTINGMANSDTIEAGKGILVETTSTLHTYTFHRETLAPADITAANTAVSDFNNRYRILASGTNINTVGSLDDGDLLWDSNVDKMKVYDATASAWKEVTSTGEFKYLFLCPDGGSGAPSFPGDSYDLREVSNSGTVASVTNAAQLIVSINGVVQKANTGTSAPAEGFAMADGNNIKFGSNLTATDNVFIIQIGSAVSIPTPGDNTVSTVKIQNLAVNRDKIAADAIDGTKLADDAVDSEHLAAGGIDLEHMSSQSVDEDNLYIDNAGSNGQYLQKQSGGTGGLLWATPAQYTTPLTTRGDVLYRGASADARLAKGTSGQFLKIGANDPEWADVPSGVTGGGTNKIFLEFEQTIDYNYTITDNHNALTAGPVTIAATGNGDSSAVVVTVGDGETWTIV
jgi:hypothetical protein